MHMEKMTTEALFLREQATSLMSKGMKGDSLKAIMLVVQTLFTCTLAICQRLDVLVERRESSFDPRNN